MSQGSAVGGQFQNANVRASYQSNQDSSVPTSQQPNLTQNVEVVVSAKQTGLNLIDGEVSLE